MAQSASTGIGSTKSIGGLHNPWIKTELLRSVAKGVGDGPPSLAAFAQVLDLRAVENGAAGHCVLSDTSHSVGAVLVPECVMQWKASMPGDARSSTARRCSSALVALNAQGHFLLHLHELRFIERRVAVASPAAHRLGDGGLAVVAAFQAACQTLAPRPPRRRRAAGGSRAAAGDGGNAARLVPSARRDGTPADCRRRRRRRRKRGGRRDRVAARRDGDAARARRVARERRRRRRWRRVCGRLQVWALYDASQDDGDGDGDGDDDGLGPLTQAPLSQPPMTQGASQWAASQASQPSPPSPGGDGGEPLRRRRCPRRRR